MFNPVIFREYDIRGVYEKEFDNDFAYLLGQGVVQYFLEKKGIQKPLIVIGNDARLSASAIKQSLSKGIQDAGGNVIYIGLVTTPMTYFSTFEIPGVSGALMITGSHNPPDYNGFKVSIGKQTIFGEEIQNLRKIIEKGIFPQGKGEESSVDIFPKYIERYQKEFGEMRPIKVVLDCGNGAAGVVVKSLFKAVGLSPTILFEEPDGKFPNHHPDPTVEKNLVSLKEQVIREGALLGIGFDGDADRIGVVDSKGKMLYGDELLVIYARNVLPKLPGAKIIGDVKCSDRLYADISKNGGVPIMWKTGHSLIKEKIKVEKAPFGGEMSGHIFFADRNYGYDDAVYAALRICEIISQTGKTIDELLEGLPTAFNTPEIRIDTTEEKKTLIVQKLKESFPQKQQNITTGDSYVVNYLDGIRISFSDGWALARASNTQPVLVLRFESNTKEGLHSIQNRINGIVNSYL